MAKTCSVRGCSRPTDTKGYCKAHYARLLRGKPLKGPIPTRIVTPRGAPMKFITEVALRHTGDDCLPWPFARGSTGYGMVTVDGHPVVASRHVCRLAHGDPPDESYHAGHNCNAGHLGCVAPGHLSWRTQLENAQDRIDAGNSLRGELNPSNVLTAEQVREIKRLRGTIGAAKIGARFGVCETTILEIHRGRKWAWLTDETP